MSISNTHDMQLSTRPTACARGACSWLQVDAALASLALLPAGSEAAGLAALDFALSQHNVAPLLAAAQAEMQSLQVTTLVCLLCVAAVSEHL